MSTEDRLAAHSVVWTKGLCRNKASRSRRGWLANDPGHVQTQHCGSPASLFFETSSHWMWNLLGGASNPYTYFLILQLFLSLSVAWLFKRACYISTASIDSAFNFLTAQVSPHLRLLWNIIFYKCLTKMCFILILVFVVWASPPAWH